MQEALCRLGYELPLYGCDGDFGSETEGAVTRFQRDHGLEVDGIAGPLTLAALEKAAKAASRYVRVTGGFVNVRSAPNTTARILGTVRQGEMLSYQGQDSPEGWPLVEYKGTNGWISGKYSEVMQK